MLAQPEENDLPSQVSSAIESHEDIARLLGTKMREESSAASNCNFQEARRLQEEVDGLKNQLSNSLASFKDLRELAKNRRLYECCQDLQFWINYGVQPLSPKIEYTASPSTCDEEDEADRIIDDVAQSMGIADGEWLPFYLREELLQVVISIQIQEVLKWRTWCQNLPTLPCYTNRRNIMIIPGLIQIFSLQIMLTERVNGVLFTNPKMWTKIC